MLQQEENNHSFSGRVRLTEKKNKSNGKVNVSSQDERLFPRIGGVALPQRALGER